MALVVDVPLNTAIADLDEALRLLLKRELDRHGFEGVDVAFDAPSKEWSGKLTGPTVDLFLYDLREASDRAELSPTEIRSNGVARVNSPPLRLELTYAVTAWTKAVEDEHRLLSQVLAILFSYRRLPADVIEGQPGGGSRLREADTSVGRPREEKADFWTSVGGSYKASVDFVVHIAVESGATVVRGPQVRMQTVRTRLADGPPGTLRELHRLGGTVRDRDGEPIADAWVTLAQGWPDRYVRSRGAVRVRPDRARQPRRGGPRRRRRRGVRQRHGSRGRARPRDRLRASRRGVGPRLSGALNRQTPCAASPAGLQLAARTTGNPLGGLRKLERCSPRTREHGRARRARGRQRLDHGLETPAGVADATQPSPIATGGTLCRPT